MQGNWSWGKCNHLPITRIICQIDNNLWGISSIYQMSKLWCHFNSNECYVPMSHRIRSYYFVFKPHWLTHIGLKSRKSTPTMQGTCYVLTLKQTRQKTKFCHVTFVTGAASVMSYLYFFWKFSFINFFSFYHRIGLETFLLELFSCCLIHSPLLRKAVKNRIFYDIKSKGSWVGSCFKT